MSNNQSRRFMSKPLIGLILVVLWIGGLSRIVFLHNATQEHDRQRICNEFGIEYTPKIKSGGHIGLSLNQRLKVGMTRSEVDMVMKGHWFKIFDEENGRDIYFYKQGLLFPMEYELYFSPEGKYTGSDKGYWTAFNPFMGFQITEVGLRLSAEGRPLLRFFWLLKWATIFYIFWLALPLIDKWRQKT